jgi:hypothetical protein
LRKQYQNPTNPSEANKKPYFGKQKISYIDNNGTPITKEISRGRSRPNKTPNIIALIKGSSHNLPA